MLSSLILIGIIIFTIIFLTSRQERTHSNSLQKMAAEWDAFVKRSLTKVCVFSILKVVHARAMQIFFFFISISQNIMDTSLNMLTWLNCYQNVFPLHFHCVLSKYLFRVRWNIVIKVADLCWLFDAALIIKQLNNKGVKSLVFYFVWLFLESS